MSPPLAQAPPVTAATLRRRETAQQIDPLSGITARIFVFVVGVISLATAVTLAFSNANEVGRPGIQVLAIVILAAAYVYFVWAAEPYRRRVTARSFTIVFAAVLLASLIDTLSQLGSDTLIRNDWGPICIALVLMLAGPYRPPLDIVGYTLISLIVISLTTAIEIIARNGTMTFISLTIAGTPAFALGVGSAIYSHYLISGLRADRVAAAELREHRELADRREAIEEFLGHDIKALRSDVLPYFRTVKTQDALTLANIDRAAELQTKLRASLVSNLSAEPLSEVVGRLDDPEHLSRRLSEPQRTALRAVLAFLAEQPTVRRKDITLRFEATVSGCRGTLACAVSSDRTIGFRATPFVGLIQLAFANVTDSVSSEAVSIAFDC
ncbi:hypothetical protein [Subtercola lobariae]|uniref:Uncharacterized protein n=1 Tax=Subtercola lobariae TaxID=1588641 RepID=A0A917B0E6_9MICO|nr:hypothetical protein [Subtercola lobariae]GGF12714.1 hypothetical protein GCM10011399_03310 [Subtercola lobariae]